MHLSLTDVVICYLLARFAVSTLDLLLVLWQERRRIAALARLQFMRLISLAMPSPLSVLRKHIDSLRAQARDCEEDLVRLELVRARLESRL